MIDGVAGARSDLAPAPSVDIANGAPTGADATNRIVMTYVSGQLAQPHVYFTESTNAGTTWSAPRAVETPGDRGLYTAPAISPNGRDVYLVYNAFTTPYRTTTTDPRALIGVVSHADSSTTAGVPTGAFTTLHRGAPGDPRGSSANSLISEFLGDYVYAVATRTYGAAVWNDARNAADCPAIDAWRMALQNGDTAAVAPAPQQACPRQLRQHRHLRRLLPRPHPVKEILVSGGAGETQGMGNRVILWGVGVCLVLLLIELSVLAATGNWLAVSATGVALARVVVATLVMIRPRGDLADAFPELHAGAHGDGVIAPNAVEGA